MQKANNEIKLKKITKRQQKKLDKFYTNLKIEAKIQPENEKLIEQEILAKAKFEQERNERIYAKRAETQEKLSKMTEEELLQYYKQIEQSNDEFLKELGLTREKISKKD